MENYETKLKRLNWVEYPNQNHHRMSRSFYKRFNTPTICCCNEKSGMQVELRVSDWEGKVSYSINLSGEIKDGSWVKFENYAIGADEKPYEEDLDEVLGKIPRMIKIWEFAANI